MLRLAAAPSLFSASCSSTRRFAGRLLLTSHAYDLTSRRRVRCWAHPPRPAPAGPASRTDARHNPRRHAPPRRSTQRALPRQSCIVPAAQRPVSHRPAPREHQPAGGAGERESRSLRRPRAGGTGRPVECVRGVAGCQRRPPPRSSAPGQSGHGHRVGLGRSRPGGRRSGPPGARVGRRTRGRRRVSLRVRTEEGDPSPRASTDVQVGVLLGSSGRLSLPVGILYDGRYAGSHPVTSVFGEPRVRLWRTCVGGRALAVEAVGRIAQGNSAAVTVDPSFYGLGPLLTYHLDRRAGSRGCRVELQVTHNWVRDTPISGQGFTRVGLGLSWLPRAAIGHLTTA